MYVCMCVCVCVCVCARACVRACMYVCTSCNGRVGQRESSLCFSQEPATDPYPESGESSSHSHTLFYYCVPIVRLGLSSGLFPSGVPTKILYAFLMFLM
jgi:hypothetical protein